MDSLKINASSGMEMSEDIDNLGCVGSIQDEFEMEGGMDVFSSPFLENGRDLLGNEETETSHMMEMIFNQLNLNRDEERRLKSVKSGKTGCVVYSFIDDEAAQSTDPKVMESTFRIPVRKVLRKECMEMVDQYDGHELVMSREFVMKLEQDGVHLDLENIEQYRGRSKTCTPDSMKRMIIKRTSPINGNSTVHRVSRIQAEGLKVMKKLRKEKLNRSSRNLIQKDGKGALLKRYDGMTPNRVETNSAANTSSPATAIKPKLEVDVTDCDHLIMATLKDEDVGYPVSLGSVKSLIPKRYLNDEVMDFGIFNILRRVHPHPDAAYVASFAWCCYFFKDESSTELSDTVYRMMTKKGTRPDLLVTRKYLVIPVVRETHWLLVIVCNPFPDIALMRIIASDPRPHIHFRLYRDWANGVNSSPPKILIFDSMYYNLVDTCENVGTFHANTAHYIRKGLHGLHLMYWKAKMAKVNVPYFNEHIVGHQTMEVPQQSNKEDCGLFCMAYVSNFFLQLKELKGDYIQLSKRDCKNWFGDNLGNLRSGLFQIIKGECKKVNSDHVCLLQSLDHYFENLI